ncbi:uncharacterized protein LOC124114999 isoform X2 [Haliotis rufescens]|nr:uncharacterized protein LOC124114999 isoform X2 [Haliotis rufescens]
MVISVLIVFFLRFPSSEGENGSNDCPAGLTGPGCKTTCSQYCVDRKCHLLTSGGTNCTLGCIAGRHGTPCTLECSRNCQHCERYNGDICRHPKSTDDAKDTGQGDAVNLRTLVIIIISLVVFAGMCIVVISLLVYRHCRARASLPTDGGKEERRKRFRRKLPPLPPSRCGKGDISSTHTAPHDYCEVKEAHGDTSSTDNQRDHVYDLDFPEQPSEGSPVSLTHIEMKVLVSPQRNTDTQSKTDCDNLHKRSMAGVMDDHLSVGECPRSGEI